MKWHKLLSWGPSLVSGLSFSWHDCNLKPFTLLCYWLRLMKRERWSGEREIVEKSRELMEDWIIYIRRRRIMSDIWSISASANFTDSHYNYAAFFSYIFPISICDHCSDDMKSFQGKCISTKGSYHFSMRL